MPGGSEFCTVTGIIQDPTGQVFANGTWTLSFKQTPNTPGVFIDTGVSGPAFTKIFGGSLDNSGSFSIGLVTRNDSISPAGSRWTLLVAPNASTQAFQVDLNIITPTLDCSSQINAAITNLVVNAQPIARAYKDSELVPPPGSGGAYFDTTLKVFKVWDIQNGVWITVGQTVTPDAPVAHNFLTGFTAGAFSAAQPVEADVVNLVADLAAKAPVNNPANTSKVFAGDFATVALAISALPANGGTVDATGANVNPALGTIDFGSRVVTLLLGTNGTTGYTIDHFVLRKGCQIIGLGGSDAGTLITSVGLNTQPMFVIPQANNSAVSDFTMKGLRCIALAGNASQDGLFADCSGFTNSGLWYSYFEDVQMLNFKGNPWHFKGRLDVFTAVNQFNTFVNCRGFRPAAGLEALRIEGGNGQFLFNNCEFDGPGITDGTNIFIGQINAGDTTWPYSIKFVGLTCQGANLGVQLSGVSGVEFDHGHWEVLHGCIQTNLVGTIANYGVDVHDNDFFGTVGVNAGAGFLWKDNSTQTRGFFKNNTLLTVADKIIIGTNLSSIAIQDNVQTGVPTVWTSVNLTLGLGAAATVSTNANHSVFVGTSATPITTIQSSLGPGEVIYFRASGGPITFTGGLGNISVGSNTNPLVLSTNDIAAFVFDDAANQWILFSYSGTKKSANAIDTTGLTANVAAATLLASGSVLGGLYRVTAHVVLTTAASVSSVLPNVQIVYTDAQTNTSITLDATPILGIAGIGQTGALSANTVGTTASGVVSINAKVATVIQYQTVNYASSIAGMTYALHVRIESLN